jgi:AcrR family transcriptional regulator
MSRPTPEFPAFDADWVLETERPARSRRREPLVRGEIVAAALRIIDAEGVEALSMRRLGGELGVKAMALYRHVRNKEHLLDLVVEGVLRDIEPPALVGDWNADIRAIAHATRRGLLRHRRAVSLVQGRPWVGPAGLVALDVTLGVYRDAGFDDRSAVFAQFALGNYVSGFCAWEAANLGANSDDPVARAAALADYARLVASLPADRYPHLTALTARLTQGSLDERFEFGLAALLRGLASEVT